MIWCFPLPGHRGITRPMIHINDLTYRIGGRVLFDQATAVIRAGHKVGLIGRNGTGKTTLFKLILKTLSPDGGDINIRKRMRVGTVSQEAPGGKVALIDSVLAADTERASLLARAEVATDPTEISDVHTRLADIEAQTAPARAARILAGLGFNEEAQKQHLDDFSGGWRMRVALAAALFSRPDILLLDEPTNHLDLEATLWLEAYLASWPGTLLVISHDRTLLNQSVTHILHLDKLKLTPYTGNYDHFEKTRREKQMLDAKLRVKQMAARKHIESFVDRFRASATKARQAQSRIKMLERMEPIAAAAEDPSVNLDFPKPDTLPPPLITLDELDAGYEPGKPILRNLDLRIDMEDRIGLLGANGNGKSTLMKLLANRLKPMSGKFRKSSKLRIGYFAQHQTEELDMTENAFDHAQRMMPMATQSKVRAHLGRFGFSGDKANTECASLSGGEKAKLLFALMSLEAPHVLLLDEPTNHLDVDAREALIQALNAYEGAVIMVSHDSHILELVCDRLWLVENQEVKAFDGDIKDYRKHLVDERRQKRRAERDSREGQPTKVNRKEERRLRAAARAETANLRTAIRDMDKQMEKLNAQREGLEVKLADPEIYEGSTSKFMALQVELGNIKSKLADIEGTWMAASEELEKAS